MRRPTSRHGRAGTHGYDVVDHCRINPELGGEEGLRRWAQSLSGLGLSHILDIVPNHAGVGTNDNTWWNDMLEHGRASRRAEAFDIAWRGSPRESLRDRVLLPVLGDIYAAALEKGDIKLAFDPNAGSFSIAYFDRRFPIDPGTYHRILASNAYDWKELLSRDDYAEYRSILSAAADSDGLQWEAISIKHRLKDFAARSETVGHLIDQAVALFDTNGHGEEAAARLDALLERQHYQLAFWRVASDEINYRRFFNINDLAGLRMERRSVFEATHKRVLELVRSGTITGVRVDHPDGLYDPLQYLQRLQEYAQPSRGSGRLYVAVEKILAADEALPTEWPVAGTTGYDFLNKVNGLFVRGSNASAFTQLHARCIGEAGSFDELAYQKKKLILRIALASELQMLTGRLVLLAEQDRRARDFTRNALKECLRELIACFPVYRTYIDRSGASERDRAVIARALATAIQRNPRLRRGYFQVYRRRAHRPRVGRAARRPAAQTVCRQVSAVDRSRHRQRRGRHGVLSLQPADLPQRGRRRPGPIRRFARRAAPLSGRPAAELA